jgi:CheY-like chemotaxis protein
MNNPMLQGKKILVVEDDFVNQMLIKHSLADTGALLDIAGNGAESIQYLKEKSYDIILMDINMPVMDGFSATRIIRTELQVKTPIIAMTGWSSKEEGDKFAEAGMDGCLAKPFGLDAFYATLNEVFNKRVEIPAPPPAPVVEVPVAPVPEVLVELPKPAPAPVSSGDVQVDLSMLYELAGDDKEYKVTIINMFLQSMPETIAKIEQAIAVQDWDQVQKSAHYAKSSVSVVQVPDLYQLSHQIELAAKNRTNVEAIPDDLVVLRQKYASVEKFLKAELLRL